DQLDNDECLAARIFQPETFWWMEASKAGSIRSIAWFAAARALLVQTENSSDTMDTVMWRIK
ncbi:hypothetical protein PJI17_32225, partial [Mycobacterium kansasii]